MNPRRAYRLVVAAILGLFAVTGCMVPAKKYRLQKDVTAAAKINHVGEAAEFRVTLLHVIAPQGPGTWKTDAKWDEYRVHFENLTDRTVQVREVALLDPLGAFVDPGLEPWELEKRSMAARDHYRERLRNVSGAGVAVYAGAAAASAMSPVAAGSAVVAAAPLVLMEMGVVAVIDHRNRKAVEAEFARRRLVLPLTLAPRAKVEGSLFFPIVPAPQRLEVGVADGKDYFAYALTLPQLAGWHLEKSDAAAK